MEQQPNNSMVKEEAAYILRHFNRRLNNFLDEMEAVVEETEEAIPELPEEEEAALKHITLLIDRASTALINSRDLINEIRNIHFPSKGG